MWVVSLHVVCQGSPKAPNTGYAIVFGHPELHGMMYIILLNCHIQLFTEKVILEAMFPSSPLQTQKKNMFLSKCPQRSLSGDDPTQIKNNSKKSPRLKTPCPYKQLEGNLFPIESIIIYTVI